MAIWTAEIKELEILYEFLKGQLPDLEKELGRLIKADDENMVLLYSRRCLEVIITDLCECELKRPRKTEPLKGIIDKLHKEDKVPAHIITSMHGLNDLSTYGAHPKDFDPEQVKPVLVNLDIIIKWYLKFKGFQIPAKQKQEVRKDNIKLGKGRKFSLSVKPGILIPGIMVIIVILGALIFLLNRHSKTKWAKTEALAEIEQLINKADIATAFSLVQIAEKYISKEPEFEELSSLVSSKLTILTDPPGADIYLREYSDIKGKWKKLGRTPISNAKIPGSKIWWTSSLYLTRIEKLGYENILAVTSTTEDTLYRKLFKQGTIPPDMVYVEGQNGFFIDRYEVTNKQFKEFVVNGGYSNPDYWKNEFIKEGKTISRDEATALFVDKTGRPGPATWEAGDYPGWTG